tara:strand:+ start:672 stop:929 length:258 start_codon:yes stop_codon:yes gene_type:complete
MSDSIKLLKEEISKIEQQLEIDVKKVSLLQQEIKEIQKQAKAAINDKQAQINDATQPLIENQGSLKKLKELLGKLEGKIEAATDK